MSVQPWCLLLKARNTNPVTEMQIPVYNWDKSAHVFKTDFTGLEGKEERGGGWPRLPRSLLAQHRPRLGAEFFSQTPLLPWGLPERGLRGAGGEALLPLRLPGI